MPTLVAYVVMRPGQVVSSSALRDHLQQSLPEPMVPAVYVVLDEFPRTSSGKLDREALPAPEEQYAAREEYMAPRTETERQIAGVWKDVLEVDRVGVHDNFFELGGHSMIATVLVSRLRDLFSVEVSVRQFFEGPTVAELADRVDATQWATESLQGATSACAAANREEGTI
jgi:acyl carrier protein